MNPSREYVWDWYTFLTGSLYYEYFLSGGELINFSRWHQMVFLLICIARVISFWWFAVFSFGVCVRRMVEKNFCTITRDRTILCCSKRYNSETIVSIPKPNGQLEHDRTRFKRIHLDCKWKTSSLKNWRRNDILFIHISRTLIII